MLQQGRELTYHAQLCRIVIIIGAYIKEIGISRAVAVAWKNERSLLKSQADRWRWRRRRGGGGGGFGKSCHIILLLLFYCNARAYRLEEYDYLSQSQRKMIQSNWRCLQRMFLYRRRNGKWDVWRVFFRDFFLPLTQSASKSSLCFKFITKWRKWRSDDWICSGPKRFLYRSSGFSFRGRKAGRQAMREWFSRWLRLVFSLWQAVAAYNRDLVPASACCSTSSPHSAVHSRKSDRERKELMKEEKGDVGSYFTRANFSATLELYWLLRATTARESNVELERKVDGCRGEKGKTYFGQLERVWRRFRSEREVNRGLHRSSATFAG